jgi:hypothetical protein
VPPGSWFDATRQHLSGYVRDHWGHCDPTDRATPTPGQAWALTRAGLAMAGAVSGPVVELGAAAGGVTRALAEELDTAVLGLDLSAPLARFAARALRGGTFHYPLRLSGTAYAEREIAVPPPVRGSCDIWIADALVPHRRCTLRRPGRGAQSTGLRARPRRRCCARRPHCCNRAGTCCCARPSTGISRRRPRKAG